MDPLANIQSLNTTTTKVNPLGTMRQKAEELEGVFLNTLMSQMFSSLDTRNGFGGGYAEETWRGMQAEQYANIIAQNGGVGLADQIMSNLIGAQESAQNQSAQNTSQINTTKAY